MVDATGKIRGQLGPGHVTVANAAGNEMGRLRAGDSGGSLDLLKGANTYSVRMGTKEDGRSDVCAAGIKGDVCLGLLAAKTMTPY